MVGVENINIVAALNGFYIVHLIVKIRRFDLKHVAGIPQQKTVVGIKTYIFMPELYNIADISADNAFL